MATDQHSAAHAVARSTVGLTGLSLLSMVTGLGVEMLLAWAFGASAIVDAYRVDYPVIWLGSQFFALQMIPNATVPVFTEFRERGEIENAWRAAMSFGNLMALTSVALAAVCFVWPQVVVAIFAPGLHGKALATALLFARWFAVAIALMAWSGAAIGILYATGVFWPPVTASVGGNVILAASIVICGKGAGAGSIIIGIALSAVATVMLVALALLRVIRSSPQARISFLFAVEPRHPGVRKSLRLSIPMVAGAGLTIWGSVVLFRALSFLPTGAISVYGYARKLATLPALLSGSLLTVMYPRLAASWCDSMEAFKADCTKTLRMALFVSLFACCLALALRLEIISLLFRHGALTVAAATATAYALMLILPGFPGFVAAGYAQRMFYAAQDSVTPTIVQMGYVFFLTVAAPIAGSRYGLDGICGLLGAGWLLNGTAMVLIFNLRHKALRLTELGACVLAALPIAIATAWAGADLGARVSEVAMNPNLSRFITIAVGSLVAGSLFGGMTLMLGMREALMGRRFVYFQSTAMLRKIQSAVAG